MDNFIYSFNYLFDLIFNFILSNKFLFIISFFILFIFSVFLNFRATMLSLSHSEFSQSDNSSNELSDNVVRIKIAENVQIISDRPFEDGETVSINDLSSYFDDNDLNTDFTDMELED